MTFKMKTLVRLTAVLALSMNACSANPARSARVSMPARECPGGVVQSANDAARFTGCTAVAGDLRVEHTEFSDLTGLASLRSVSGTFTVAHNRSLADLAGLEGLRAVHGLVLLDNPELADISALSTLRDARMVELRSNPGLETLRGLEGLNRVENLTLVDNGLFETAGLSHLREVGQLTVAANQRLISLRGLNGLKRAGSVHIRNNRLLCGSLGLLPQLGEVTSTLELSSNRSLSERDLDGLRQHVKSGFVQPTLATR